MKRTFVHPNVTPVSRPAPPSPPAAPYRMTEPLSQRDLVKASLLRKPLGESR